MKMKHLSLLALSPLIFFGLTSASGDTPDAPVEETPIVEPANDSETEQVKEEIKKFKDTYIVPIFSTVFGTVSVGTILSVFFAFKNRKTNKLMKEENDKIIAFVKNFYKTATEIVMQVEEVKKVCDATIKVFDEKVSTLIKEVDDLKVATDKVAGVKKVLITLGEIQTEMVKVQPSAVTSGVAKSLGLLNEQIKSLE